MKKCCLVLMAILSMAVFSACDGVKEYTISGSFDLPTVVQMGDTTIERGPIDGVRVYLLDIEGEPIDSVMIENESFEFSGKVDPKNPFFAYIVCEWGAGMLVVEPGEISVEMTAEGVVSTGTPLNDDIADLEAALQNTQAEFYDQMLSLYNSVDSLSQKQMLTLYLCEQQALLGVIDSVYSANSENMVGVYAVNLLVGQSANEQQLDEFLSDYSDYVKNSALIMSYRNYLKSGAVPAIGEGEALPFGEEALEYLQK